MTEKKIPKKHNKQGRRNLKNQQNVEQREGKRTNQFLWTLVELGPEEERKMKEKVLEEERNSRLH